MADVPLPPSNPYDKSHLYPDIDVGATEGSSDTDRDDLLRAQADPLEAREQARVQNARGTVLTESRALAIMAEFVEQQKQQRINALMLTPITDANKDELNFTRGEVAGLMLALKYVQAVASGAAATLELFKEEDRINDRAN